MIDSPTIWRVNKSPRFTVLELGEYMAADDGPRETILRDMRFERLARTLGYQHIYRAVTRYLTSPTRDSRILEECRKLIQSEIESTINPTKRDNLTYELRALDTFQNSLNAIGLSGLNLEAAPASPFHDIEGVRVSIQPTAYLRVKRQRGNDLGGVIIVDLAKGITPKSLESQERLLKNMRHATALLFKHAVREFEGKDRKASPDHCIIFHSYRQETYKCPQASKKMLSNIEAVCRNIARSWDGIKPPRDFDESHAEYRN